MAVTPEQMPPERWLALIKEVGITDLETLACLVVEGQPFIIPVRDDKDSHVKYLAVVTEAHAKHLSEIWTEIEESFNASV